MQQATELLLKIWDWLQFFVQSTESDTWKTFPVNILKILQLSLICVPNCNPLCWIPERSLLCSGYNWNHHWFWIGYQGLLVTVHHCFMYRGCQHIAYEKSDPLMFSTFWNSSRLPKLVICQKWVALIIINIFRAVDDAGTATTLLATWWQGDMILTGETLPAWLVGVVSGGSVQYQLRPHPPEREERRAGSWVRESRHRHHRTRRATSHGPGFLGNNNWICYIMLHVT